MLKVENVSGGYGKKDIVNDISFEVKKGEFFGIIGPNGSGKTTLLKIISRILEPSKGNVSINSKSIFQYTAKQFAQKVAVLPQHTSDSFSYTVKETVSLGRYAHQTSLFQMWTNEDEQIVNDVMEKTGVLVFKNKFVNELSGGERQRVFLAQALAQEPEILLLDEPTNHLDLSYQKDLLDLLRKWSDEQGLTVISIFHDLNLASLYCDNLLLLEKGAINIVDDVNEVLKQDRIKAVYKTDIDNYPHPKVARPQMILIPDKSYLSQDDIILNEKFLTRDDDVIVFSSPILLRTMSSSVIGAGTGWYRTFVNRHVDKSYSCFNHVEEMATFLKDRKFDLTTTAGMMTAVNLDDVVYRHYQGEKFSIFIVVTAGVGNAVDTTKREQIVTIPAPGTINTWVFVNGDLSAAAFIHSIMTASEVKAKVMAEQQVIDEQTGTIATGTSTDSILIAATQRGEKLQYGGSVTPLGTLLSKAIYETLTEAIQKNHGTTKDDK